jgi:small subunit ribosomal protein S2
MLRNAGPVECLRTSYHPESREENVFNRQNGHDGTYDNLSKREKLQIARQRAKLEKNLGSISDLTRLPAAMFIVDISKEHIAVHEARRLNIPIFAMVDTNSDPNLVDFPIPSNDDASKSIALILETICKSIQEGLDERKMEREKEADASDKKARKEDRADDSEETMRIRRIARETCCRTQGAHTESPGQKRRGCRN